MIENTVASVVYTADGAQTQWTIPFSYGHVEDVKLFVKVGTADIAPVASNLYSVDTELNTITYPLSGDPLAANDKVIVMRVTEQTQEESSAMLSFKSEDIERIADKLTMEVQELQEQLSRCIAFNPVDAAEGELDAQQYIDDLTDLKDTATTQAGIATSAATTATTQAGLASDAKTAAETAQSKAEKWAEGTDQEVAALGGTHSAEGWAGISQTAAESENVQTVIANMSDINSVADNITDVTTVSNISAAVSNVADNDTEVLLVSDNMASVITTASNINNVNTVAGVSTKVSTVADNISDVGTVADNISDIGTVANVSAAVSTVANDINAVKAVNNNKTNIDAVATNQSNINAVASNATNINAVNANKTNIDAVAGNATNINTVATNATAVSSVATAIADVSAVANDLTDIGAVADDLTNIDTVAASLPDIQDKQNKVLTNSVILGGETQTTVEGALEAISEDWVKPADWVDIRSGAVENSITLLVAHSAPTESGGVYTVATYPQFHILAQVSTAANTYDIFVDGVKVATTASGTKTVIDWGTLYGAGTVSTIYTTTTPEALVYHIVRVSPTTATDTLTQFQNNVDSSNTNQGILWAHYQLSNPIAIYAAFGGGSRPRNTILQAVTAKNDTLIYTVGSLAYRSGFYSTFAYCSSLVKVPILQAESQTYGSGDYVSFRGVPAKRIIIKNNSGLENFSALNSSGIGELIAENGLSFESTLATETSSVNINNLKKLPAISSNMGENILISRADSLQDTVIDDSTNTNRKVFRFFGTAAYPNTGLKGLTVSSSAPFDGASPQINVSYTGMNRAALIRLFKSMPYNVGYELTGDATVTNGILTGVNSSSSCSTSITLPSNFNELEFMFKARRYTWTAPSQILPICAWGTGASTNRITTNAQSGEGEGTRLITGSSSKIAYIDNSQFDVTAYTDSGYYTRLRVIKNTNDYTYELGVSADKQTWVTASANYSTNICTNKLWLLKNSSGSTGSTGEMDLNETYVKVDGVPFFTGTAAMTKTCSVVGCTGTANLTADDKAIATGKGWELTVA